MSGFLLSHNKDGMMALTLIILGGLLSIAYGFWAISDVMKRDAGSQRMQEIAGAIAEAGATSVRDMVKVMAALKARYAGQMDFGKVSALVKAKLK